MSADESDPETGHDESIDCNQPRVRPHQDPETLRELYHDEGLSQAEVADRLDCDQTTISKWMRKFGIETRPSMDERERDGFYRTTDEDGKVQYLERSGNGPNHLIFEHQLVALHDYSVSEVFDRESHVHHLMGAPHAVDLPENLVVLDAGEHVRRHAEGTATDDPEVVLAHIFDEFAPALGADDTEATEAD